MSSLRSKIIIVLTQFKIRLILFYSNILTKYCAFIISLHIFDLLRYFLVQSLVRNTLFFANVLTDQQTNKYVEGNRCMKYTLS